MPAMASTLTPFKAEYKLFYGDWHLGTGIYSLEKMSEEQYAFNFESTLKILVFRDYRVVRSEFNHLKNRLYPLRYSHDRKGTGADYSDLVIFDEANNIVKSKVRGKTATIKYDKKLMDGLSVQLQLMLDVKRRDQVFTYVVFENNMAEKLRFKKIGKETIVIDNKVYETMQFEAIRRGGQLKTHIWFAESLNYLPIKMVHFINGSKRFNGELIRYEEN